MMYTLSNSHFNVLGDLISKDVQQLSEPRPEKTYLLTKFAGKVLISSGLPYFRCPRLTSRFMLLQYTQLSESCIDSGYPEHLFKQLVGYLNMCLNKWLAELIAQLCLFFK